MLKFVVFAAVLTVAHSEGVGSCITSPASGDADPAAAACTEAKCKGPIFVEKTGVTDVKYGCGACDGSAETDANCKSCDKENCNTVIAMGDDYECGKWEWSTDKYVEAAAKTTCKSLKDADRKCNKPGESATTDNPYAIQADGCGACPDAAEKAKTCMSYNSAMGVSALLLPLLAALYALF